MWVFCKLPVESVPSCVAVMMVSKKDMASSCLVFPTVNCIALSMELMCCMNLSLGCFSYITKVLSMYLFQNLGGFSVVLMALFSNSSIYSAEPIDPPSAGT